MEFIGLIWLKILVDVVTLFIFFLVVCFFGRLNFRRRALELFTVLFSSLLLGFGVIAETREAKDFLGLELAATNAAAVFDLIVIPI